MNPNLTAEQSTQAQSGFEAVPPQPSELGISSAQVPKEQFTIMGPAQPLQQEAAQPVSIPEVPSPAPQPIPEEYIQHAATQTVAEAPAPQFTPETQAAQPIVQPGLEVPAAPTFVQAQPQPAPEAQYTQPTIQPGPEAIQPPIANVAPQPSANIPSTETQAAAQTMAPNLGPDVAVEQAQAAAALAIPHAPLLNNSGEKLEMTAPDVVVGIDPSAEASAEAQNPDTEKKITKALAFAQSAWEKAGRNTDPDYTKAARAAIQGALEKDLTAIMGQDWKAPDPEESWS